ncbi:DUF4199 domain-containing protein [Albibacterium indicum]|uniref:DUF4199 domain-containing protein n=1 Tax=Albibacterium indicum TaxID=2292082 RepID=UPI000E511C4C|nr:DUF4199 domain-containing protein [Pedobacter indicus]
MNHTTSNGNISATSLAVKYGLIWSAINIVVFLLVYYGMPQIMGTWKHSIIQFVVGIGLAIYFTLEIRKQIGGFWSFKEALKNIFILFIIPTVVVYFFSIIFGKWIEPEYPAKITEISLNATTEMMESMTTDQEVIDETIAEMEKGLEKQFNPGIMDILQSIAISALIYFVGALIWAAIFKRDRPVFVAREPENEDPLNE